MLVPGLLIKTGRDVHEPIKSMHFAWFTNGHSEPFGEPMSYEKPR
jgi:hypothetical protein